MLSSSPSSVMFQFRTSAEIFVGKRDASKTVVWPTPEAPRIRFFQSSSTLTPSGVMHPIPVITTRRRSATIQTPSTSLVCGLLFLQRLSCVYSPTNQDDREAFHPHRGPRRKCVDDPTIGAIRPAQKAAEHLLQAPDVQKIVLPHPEVCLPPYWSHG